MSEDKRSHVQTASQRLPRWGGNLPFADILPTFTTDTCRYMDAMGRIKTGIFNRNSKQIRPENASHGGNTGSNPVGVTTEDPR